MLCCVCNIAAGPDGVMNNRAARLTRLGPSPGGAVRKCQSMPPQNRKIVMSEVSHAPKAKAKAATPAASMFELPKFEMPSFEMPHMEVPAAFREFAEKSVSQAKDSYERMKSAAEEATDVLEDTYATATKGASDYGLKVIEAVRTNTNATFDFATQIMTVKS